MQGHAHSIMSKYLPNHDLGVYEGFHLAQRTNIDAGDLHVHRN